MLPAVSRGSPLGVAGGTQIGQPPGRRHYPEAQAFLLVFFGSTYESRLAYLSGLSQGNFDPLGPSTVITCS
jgi:hypothetical protein